MSGALVGVVGYNQIGKRVADAIAAAPDLQLAGVYERDARRREVIRARQVPLVTEELEAWAAGCAVVVVCEPISAELTMRTVFAPLVHIGQSGLSVPCADALAFVRLLTCLPPVNRLFSSCARRSDPPPAFCLVACALRFHRPNAVFSLA